jgi:class 3 adenylate cyclase/tetratricopeptide (TPR) repeat protein
VSVVERAVAPDVEEPGAAAAIAEGICPRCGEANVPGYKLCGYCGSPLVLAAKARESRKTVTIVFADPKPEHLGDGPPTPEALRDAMAAYFEAMRIALERHGATIETFIGDAVMAVFGLPIRHEDDAVRAVRAAADMQAALPALNNDLRARFGLEIGNHIGVNTGEVIAGDASLGQRLVTGDAVNTAARLEQAAGHGQIIVGELTYRLARDHIDVEEIPPLSLKGKAEPVPAYRLVGVRARPVERTTALSPFVGREAEMARLATALEEARTGHRASLVAVIGDAGVGKSRLIKEFAIRASEGGRVVRGRCLPYGDGITFWPIAEIVREAADVSAEDSPDAARAKVAALVGRANPDREEVDRIVERVAAALSLSDTSFPVAELFWGIRRLLEGMATDGPLVAIVDDIHSAETTFLDLLDHLLEAVAGAPMVLLCSARHELLDKHAEWSETHSEQQVVLQPLSEGAAGDMIERLLGEAGLDPAIRARVVGAAEGNPLFVEQMVSMLVDQGVLRREGERWVAAGGAESVVVPPTIHALLAARLDNLQPTEREVVEPAAVVGLFFAQAAVEELVREPLRTVVPAELSALGRKQFVRPEEAEGEPAFRFGHQLIRDTAYGSLLKRERAALHERFVVWAERINKERGRETEFEEILGYHLEQAYRYRRELGPIDAEGRVVGERAAAKLGSAGLRAKARGDTPAAANLLARAIAALPRASRFRLELSAELGDALVALGRFNEATRVLDEAAAAAVDMGDEQIAARTAVIRLYAEVFGPGDTSMIQAIEKAKGVIAQLEDSGDDAGLARAWRIVMLCDATLGRLEDASAAADRVIEHATRAGDPALASRNASAIVYVLVHGPTPVAVGIERCRELLTSTSGDRRAEAAVLNALAQLLAMNGEFDEARFAYQSAQAMLLELGVLLEASTTSIESSRVELLAGDPKAAEAQLRRDDAVLADLGERYYRSTVTGILANVLAARGAFEEASSYSSLSESLADADDVWSQVAWRLARARVAVASGDPERAVALAEKAVALAEPTEDIALRAESLVALSEILRAAAREDESGPPFEEALRLYDVKGDRSSAVLVRNLVAGVPK